MDKNEENKIKMYPVGRIGIDNVMKYMPISDIKKKHGWESLIFKEEKNKKLSVLDLGGANAFFGQLYKDYIKTYHCFDIKKQNIEYLLKRNCDFEWYTGTANLKRYDLFLKRYENILLKDYDIVVFNRVFHHLYFFRQSKKWKSKKYIFKDALFNSFKKARKWYVFSTTGRYMDYFGLIEFFKFNGFKLIYQNRLVPIKYPTNNHRWDCIFKK